MREIEREIEIKAYYSRSAANQTNQAATRAKSANMQICNHPRRVAICSSSKMHGADFDCCHLALDNEIPFYSFFPFSPAAIIISHIYLGVAVIFSVRPPKLMQC
jgi:hypothetical protein